MEAKAIARYVRLTPRKARLVADVIRGKSALQALDTLRFTNKKAADVIKKALSSAIANATNTLLFAILLKFKIRFVFLLLVSNSDNLNQ